MDIVAITGIEVVKELKYSTEISANQWHDYEVMSSYLKRVSSAGAVVHILKKTPPGKLLEAIEELVDGRRHLSNQVARKVVAFQDKNQKRIRNETALDVYQREKEMRNDCKGTSVQGDIDSLFIE